MGAQAMTHSGEVAQHAEELLKLARASVMQSQSGSIARLQQDLGLGHSIAAALIDRLEHDGTLMAAFGPRQRSLHPRFVCQHVRNVSASERPAYASRIVALALFFFECWEEGRRGDSRAANAISPTPTLDFAEMRTLFLDGWFGTHRMSLEQAALALHDHLALSGRTSLTDCAIGEAIANGCIPFAREPVFSFSDEECTDRAHLRLARYYRQMLSDGVNRDSRAIEWFVAPAYFPHGVSDAIRYSSDMSVGRHPEHVVPCAYIRDLALRYLEEQRSLDEVVQMTRRCLAIVTVTNAEWHRLDRGEDALLDRMPDGWNEQSGCIYERLHVKGIAFLANDRPCKCGHADCGMNSVS
jgi:hypothetical protein